MPDETVDARLAADRAFFEQGCADPRMVALEQQRPGICKAINTVSLEESGAIYREALAPMRADAALLFANVYSEADGQQMIALLTSPAGRKMTGAFVRTAAVTRSENAATVSAAAGKGAEDSLTAQDKANLDRMESRALRAKRLSLQGPMIDLANKYAERLRAEKKARIGPRVRDVLVNFKGDQ
ncbi:hypothetical protein [Sphingomonas sp. R-74633]|uniref:hypothetical protein n=1 Tax=Sphingomonas sp. R-74633 TaxID=2751188 RepID=UPI0015D1E36F|nr:hypothetical protein [Sphingomonas sp. R-74633]